MQKNIKTKSQGELWGAKAAYGCKCLLSKLRNLDKRCVNKAKEKNIPAWIGHIPILMLGISVVTTLILSAIVTAIIVVFLFIIIWLLSNAPDTARLKHGHYDLDGYHYPDGSVDHSDRY
ncbi:hypothetical protein [Xenorhabdus koppenhoeferi]|uniref:DUF3742 family protein n=1 Tax=Xenorhabdus koppenhoeferi TaxID=351659 RepID=A0A1I7JQB1_9GAMM|nr:hypothetical protein [Xenorhabdus koppenhoeferi]CEE93032.1 hypothetical protein XNA1_3260009 [Xenorhabdus nematophila str. Anatoliense]SFU87296.1 hypothetical protein SAMN05421784_1378 [Xenorhabdus koppenhoeferi]